MVALAIIAYLVTVIVYAFRRYNFPLTEWLDALAWPLTKGWRFARNRWAQFRGAVALPFERTDRPPAAR